MKNILLVLILFSAYQISYSQCSTTATNFGNNTVGSYEVTGDVTVTYNANNTVTLDLGSNFMTASGPDIRAYLINSNGLSDSALQSTPVTSLINIEFGLVGCTGCTPAIPANGAKSFTVAIPNGQDIRDYDKVFFYCLEFNAFWDFGSFTSFSNLNCNLLSINDIELEALVKVYPNPASDKITIDNSTQLPVSVSIFSILGKEILKTENFSISNKKINLSSLKAGVYLLRVTSDNKTYTSRLIKQ
ncbi:DM13 domain-containing protein [Seonamhaeicola sp. ML3]|uniref:T9SS type A sorting domain-containing protein n=1 Tax=Seonamhaeicola sp. ML3 TaxID=2937786 RepID=UPI00200BA7CC|nr:DM13 domain-containing protein [Seonamhaeicola sp. ML3]